MIPQDVIDQIMQSVDIIEVVGEFVPLKKSGSSYRGLSPFTSEKTPSFYVVPSKGIFKDFSSGKGGSAVTFLMEHEKMSYPEALRWLADKYGIELQEEKPSEEVLQERSERESLLAVSQWAANYFEKELWEGEEGQAIGLSYFQERGFRDDIMKKFKLGYCPEGWETMTTAALEAGYDEQWLLASGLTKESNGKKYDFFHGRVMFPIQDISGRVIAFGGRTLKTEKKVAKYFNSPESALYNKSRILYGIFQAKNAIVREGRCFLVEGYTDVVSLHQAGVENVVASSGTALTEDQVKLIKRYSENVTILYDGDPAGIRASFRGIDLILAQGLNVRVVLFPDGEDPDSFAKRVSSTELTEYLEKEAKDFIEFKTSILSKEAGKDPVKRADMIREVVSSIVEIPDQIKRQVYIQECSRLLDMAEQVLMNETNKLLRAKLKRKSKPGDYVTEPEVVPVPQPEPKAHTNKKTAYPQELDFVRLLLNFGKMPIQVSLHNLEDDSQETAPVSVAEYLLFELRDEKMDLHDHTLRKITTRYGESLDQGKFPEDHFFLHDPDQGVVSICADLLTEKHQMSENWSERHQIYPETEDMNLAKAVKDCVYRLKLRHALIMIDEIQEALKTDLPTERMLLLLEEKRHLDEVKRELSRYFGSAII
ncbi:DNA primase [Sanyastnella coralliicola]|uniref:DNA primase n=1 Tax=Sanyastnella coralliicola TaxID=3069118 RepID=UPI0027B8E55C|nr:DNA primase [Longitalea sp. SCSIO 12813]